MFDDLKVIKDQIELSKSAYEFGIPQFGSCWAQQIATVAAGGTCALNPNGREMFLARKITLSDDGRAHPMYEGKPRTFDAFTSHNDECTHLPYNGMRLSGNQHTNIQSVCITHKNGTFWAVQYHPEYDMREIARLVVARKARLMDLGFSELKARLRRTWPRWRHSTRTTRAATCAGNWVSMMTFWTKTYDALK